jgi:Tfp pilus assembly protein PilO
MLPSTVDNIRLIIDLNSVAVQHGLSLRQIRAAAAPESQAPKAAPASPQGPDGSNALGIATPTPDTVNISFSVTAPYQQFISFMQDLEADLRIMDVKHLTVSVGEAGAYTFQVELKTYWLRQ